MKYVYLFLPAAGPYLDEPEDYGLQRISTAKKDPAEMGCYDPLTPMRGFIMPPLPESNGWLALRAPDGLTTQLLAWDDLTEGEE